MKPILIVKNISHEGPGLLAEVLAEENIALNLVDLHQGETFPSPEAYGAVIVLGGPDSANDDNIKMQNELACIREALDLELPYLGICLGLQTLVKAAGGSVVRNAVAELGFRNPDGEQAAIALTQAGKNDALFLGLSNSFHVFHLHGETVVTTNSMKVLATGPFCENQIVKVADNAYGIQCHFELTPTMFADWLTKDADLLVMDQQQLKNDFELIKEEYTNTGKTLLRNFLRIAGYK